jgi:hypothetical protein
MKKLVVVGIAALSLTLTACGGQNFDTTPNDNYDYGGYSSNGGYTSSDWDLNSPSIYNNNTYCNGGTYTPLANDQFSCNRNGVITTPAPRPKVIVPPKSAQKPPADVLKRVEQQKAQVQQQKAQQQKQNSAPKPAAPAPKAPAPAPYRAPAPAPKTGK